MHPKSLIDEINDNGGELAFSEFEWKIIEYIQNFWTMRYPNLDKPCEIGDERIEEINDLVQKIWQLIPHDLHEEFEKSSPYQKGERILMERSDSIPRNREFEIGINRKSK